MCNITASQSLPDHDYHNDRHEGDEDAHQPDNQRGHHEGRLHDRNPVHAHGLVRDRCNGGLECTGLG